MWAFKGPTKGIKLSRCILGTVGSSGFRALTHTEMDFVYYKLPEHRAMS